MERNWCCPQFQEHGSNVDRKSGFRVVLVWRGRRPFSCYLEFRLPNKEPLDLSFAKILSSREINSLHTFLNPPSAMTVLHVPLLPAVVRTTGSLLSFVSHTALGELGGALAPSQHLRPRTQPISCWKTLFR